MPITTIPGVSFYDNWVDAALGTGVPLGWTKITGAFNPTVALDLTSSSGKVLQMPFGLFAMTMDAAGTNHNHFEILMRLKVSMESGNINPRSDFGGPAGRLSMGANLIGIGANLTNKAASCSCGVPCQNCQHYGRGHPLYPGVQSATGHANWQDLRTVGSNGSVALAQSSDIEVGGIISGQVEFMKGACPGGGYHYVCPPTQTQYGDVVLSWIFQRIRVGPEPNRIRAMAWADGSPEPPTWLTDTYHINLFWPPSPSGGLGMMQTANLNRQGTTSVDFISITIDPDQTQAPIPDPVENVCPLPDGRIGVPYTFDFDINNHVL